MEGKRPAEDGGALVLKKQRTEDGSIVPVSGSDQKALVAGPKRTSGLAAPIMQLSGHKGEVYALRFSPSGQHMATGSFDKEIFLWNVYGECENYAVLKGHTSAVLELNWASDDSNLVSCSADRTVAYWDADAGRRIRKFTEHTSFVNSCGIARRGPPLLCSGSDDNFVKLWDARVKASQNTYDSKYPVTAVCFNDNTSQIFSTGIDNEIKVWDIAKGQVVMKLQGHEDTPTGLRLSPDGSFLLSNAMDNTVRIWDIRPFVKGPRCIKIFQGVQHNFEKTLLRCSWSPDGSKISAGSADRFVYVWEVNSRRILYKLPGHRGTVNEVDWHPTEPIVGSASSDRTVFIGELGA